MKKQLQRHEEELKHPSWMDDLMKEVNKVFLYLHLSSNPLFLTLCSLDRHFRKKIRALPIGLPSPLSPSDRSSAS
jgi:hypothetical protein